jgi:hypothetical protein
VQFQEDPQAATEILDKFFKGFVVPGEREGQHPSVTDLIYCLTKSYWNVYSKIPESEKTRIYFVLGLALEKALIGTIESGEDAGEFQGIHYHLDLVDEQGLQEVKTTRKSAKTTPETFPNGWMKQIMGYCVATGKSEATFYILHIIQAEIKAWRIQFDPTELAMNWKWLEERKAVWDRAVVEGKAPTSYKYNEKWECRDCVYSTRCEAMKFIRDYNAN